MRAALVFDRDASVLIVTDKTGRVEVRGSARVGVDAPPSDPVQQALDRLSGPCVSSLFAGDAVFLSPTLPGRMSGDYDAMKPIMQED